MAEAPRWRQAWLAELLARLAAEPTLLPSCPRPVAECLEEIATPSGVLPEVLVAIYRDPEAAPC